MLFYIFGFVIALLILKYGVHLNNLMLTTIFLFAIFLYLLREKMILEMIGLAFVVTLIWQIYSKVV
jgi:hypothetical protein